MSELITGQKRTARCAEFNETYVGKTFKILVEGKSKNNDKMYTGRTTSNKVVVFEASEEDKKVPTVKF